MPRKPSPHPTEFELTILKILWLESPITVREIREELSELGREVAHTSVITMLNIMVEKGYLKKEKQGKQYVFWPIVEEAVVSNKMLGDMVDRVFDGSAKRLVLNLIDSPDLDRDELLELRKMINQSLRDKK